MRHTSQTPALVLHPAGVLTPTKFPLRAPPDRVQSTYSVHTRTRLKHDVQKSFQLHVATKTQLVTFLLPCWESRFSGQLDFPFLCVDLCLPLGPYLCVTRCEEAVSVVTAALYSVVGVWITRPTRRGLHRRHRRGKSGSFRFQERLLTARIALARNNRQHSH